MDEITETKDRMVDTALNIAEASSWESLRLFDLARETNLSLEEIYRHFREKEDIVDVWFDRADRHMLLQSQSSSFTNLSSPERLHHLMMNWLSALGTHQKVTRQMIYNKLEPGHLHMQVLGAMRVSRTVQWMREAAQRDAAYLSRAVEETVLTGIYLSAFFFWMHDSSPGFERTSRFLRRMLFFAQRLSRPLTWLVPKGGIVKARIPNEPPNSAPRNP